MITLCHLCSIWLVQPTDTLFTAYIVQLAEGASPTVWS